MLSTKRIVTRIPPLLLRGCYCHTPAASSVVQYRRIRYRTSSYPCFFQGTERRTTIHNNKQNPSFCNKRFFSSHPICDRIDTNIANDLSPEGYDQAYMFLYNQHSHPHGPIHKFLNGAQKVLRGAETPRILVLGSGPGEPSSTLAANFPNAEVTSAHSTKKSMQLASNRFQELGLSNVCTKLLPDKEDLSAFDPSSFDLVVISYGLASVNPCATLNEIHRVLTPGGTFLASVWEYSPADVACDIILRNSCSGGKKGQPSRSKHPTELGQPHLLEKLIENAKMSVIHVSNDEYPLKLGKTKEFAFKTLTLNIRDEIIEAQKSNRFNCDDAAEAFDDVVKEGFMVKEKEDGELEVPYNQYKFIVARREYEDDDDDWRQLKAIKKKPAFYKSQASATPFDIRHDPIIIDTWNRMKPAASGKILKVLTKQLDIHKSSQEVKILDSAPDPYKDTSVAIAADYPNASIEVTSKSPNVLEDVAEPASARGLRKIQITNQSPMHMAGLHDKSYDIILCTFGLTFLSSPKETLAQFRRVLKPGGVCIFSVWEDFALRQLSDSIIAQLHSSGELEDFSGSGCLPNVVLDQLLPYARPRELEHMIVEHGFHISHVEHETARIILSDASCKSDYGENIATLPIRPFLTELERSGQYKNAFKDAKRAFESILRDPSLVTRDKCGNLVTTLPSRYKIITATRPYEDSDGVLDSTGIATATGQKFRIKCDDIPK